MISSRDVIFDEKTSFDGKGEVPALSERVEELIDQIRLTDAEETSVEPSLPFRTAGHHGETKKGVKVTQKICSRKKTR